MKLYAREQSCLEAAKCLMRLDKWEDAERYLNRAVRSFPKGDKAVLAEARKLQPKVRKELAKRRKPK